jgi:hypothetical protein
MILAIDPGLASGIMYGTPDNFEHDIIPFPQIYSYLDDLISTIRFDVVVIENFLISGQTGKKTQAPWSLKIIGACEHICIRENVEMVLQTPSEAKNFITDKKLKEFGLWFKGEGHDRDAARHYMLWYFKNRPKEVLP